MTGEGSGSDAYARRLRSERYRVERAAKAEVILALCGDRLAEARRPADLGSGTGLIKKEIERRLHKYLYAFEMDVSFMEWRRGTAVADATRLPVRDGALDFLVVNHLYEHVEEQPALFREAWRVLAPGGGAYVAAGNALAVIEPHYRLPFLSWLPRPAADAYLRATGRGRAYQGIRFRTYGRLRAIMEGAGFRVVDATERALDELLGPARGGVWLPVWAALRRLPAAVRRGLLRGLSPQWFFLLEKPPEGDRRATPRTGGAPGREATPVDREDGEVV